MKLSKNFEASEFVCGCGACDGGKMSEAFIERLQKMRDLLAVPLKINSGFRCQKHNIAEGGSKYSMHMAGRAADIHINNGAEAYAFINAAMAVGFMGIGVAKTFIHVDDRESQTIWTY